MSSYMRVGSRTAPLALLACAILLACGEVAAQARGAPVERASSIAKDPLVERVAALAELDTWLRRLAGRFQIIMFDRPIGEANCVGIGAGPGVHCIYRFAPPGRNDDRWRAQVRMFGLDLDAPGIGYLRINEDSTAEGGVASLRGDAIFFIGDCPVIQPARTGPVIVTVLDCQQELRMQARPGKDIRIRNRIRQSQMVSTPPTPDGRLTRPRRTRTSYTMEWVLKPLR